MALTRYELETDKLWRLYAERRKIKRAIEYNRQVPSGLTNQMQPILDRQLANLTEAIDRRRREQ